MAARIGVLAGPAALAEGREMTLQGHSRAAAVLGLIDRTPTVPLRFEPEGVTIQAKCEFLNPSGSVKDRFAAAVIA